LVVNLPSTLACTQDDFVGTAGITGSCAETNYTNNEVPWTLPVTANFDLFVTKTQPAGAEFAQLTPSVTYSINYGNLGARTVFPVVLTEYLPLYTTFVAALSNPGWTAAGSGVYTYNVGTVAANAPALAVPITFTVTATLPVPVGVNTIENVVNVNSTGNCGAEIVTANNVASVITPVVGSPDVFVQKTDNGVEFFGNSSFTSPGSQFSGDVVVYTLSYGNQGSANAVNVTLTETVPVNTVFDAEYSSAGWTCADGAPALSNCYLNVGQVPIPDNGASGVIYGYANFSVRATTFSPSGYPQAITCNQPPTQNFVSISVGSTQTDSNLTNNNANATTPFAGLPELSITKNDDVHNNPALAKQAGDNIIYTITYANYGVRQATNAVIFDTIPEYTIFNGQYSSPGWACAEGGVANTNCTYSLGNIAPGQNTSIITLAVTLQSGFPASVTCVTNVVYIDNDCGGPEATASVCTPVTGYFDLVLQKHGYCETIQYQISYSNEGDIGARDVYLKTYVPVDSTFDAENSNADWNCTGITPGSECLLHVTNPEDYHAYLPPGSGGTVNFAVDPYPSSTSATFTLESSISDNWNGDDLDPTPDNNRVSTTVGFSGCSTCDSCCPVVDTCCPDYTDVAFNFGGVLDGINTCS
jgi:uncharacterized repeat protein (TIGR01451 family)